MEYIERYWRDATPKDAIASPPMVARFRDINYPWKINTLRGVRQGAEFPWFSESKGSFQQCQVYDAPDPGDGWRLIDVEKDRPCENDEIWSGYKWTAIEYFSNFCLPNHYRRRIEQPKPQYVPFEWEDREQLRGRWIAHKDGNLEMLASSFFSTESCFFVGTFDAQKLLDNWRFVDTNEPVGKRVL